MRYKLALLAALCAISKVKAQNVYNISGMVYTSGGASRVAGVAVSNTRTKLVTYSTDIGVFTISATIGDTLEFVKTDLTTARQLVSSPTDMMIYMLPVTRLNEVIIKTETKKQELDEVVNIYRSKGLYFDGRPPWWIFNPIAGSPLTGFYELFGHDAANERRFIKFSKDELAASQSHSKYNKEIVKKLTNLSDDEAQKFIDTYQPSYQELMKWNDYEIIAYIKKSYESYKKNGALALPSLNAPQQ